MEQYHGTNVSTAKDIIAGKIDVTKGGGELGQGFYTGDLCHEAFNWAWHKYGKDKAVVQLTLDDDYLLTTLKPMCLNLHETIKWRNRIKYCGATRTFKFSTNVVWAPIVGNPIPNFNQFKYESNTAKGYLNGSTVTKKTL